MSLSEFELINQFFKRESSRRDVIVGIGDDCAIVNPAEEQSLAVTTDTLIEGVHFPSNTSAKDIAYKALAVNISDLAASGAQPAWITLALTLTEVNEPWLTEFAEELLSQCEHFGIQLIGGDTCRGKQLSITLTAQGFLPSDKALLRSTALEGDIIYVTGSLGDARYGLAIATDEVTVENEADKEYFLTRLNRPTPRLAAAIQTRTRANAMIDISDGLVVDLKHILEASQVGAIVDVEKLPLSATLRKYLSDEQATEMALQGGDDYELCFTVPADMQKPIETALTGVSCPFTEVGRITGKKELKLLKEGHFWNFRAEGYKHFS